MPSEFHWGWYVCALCRCLVSCCKTKSKFRAWPYIFFIDIYSLIVSLISDFYVCVICYYFRIFQAQASSFVAAYLSLLFTDTWVCLFVGISWWFKFAPAWPTRSHCCWIRGFYRGAILIYDKKWSFTGNNKISKIIANEKFDEFNRCNSFSLPFLFLFAPLKVLRELSPSLSMAELKKYEMLRDQFQGPSRWKLCHSLSLSHMYKQ